MAKREREDWNGSDVDVVVDKKRKRHHSKPKRPKTSSVSAGPARIESTSVAPTITNSKLTPSKSQIGVLKAPPGLTKGQRKRWRKQQKKLAEGAPPRGSQQHQSKAGRNEAQVRSETSITTQSANQSAKTAPRKPFRDAFAVTQLMPRRQREWHGEAQADKVTESRKTPLEDVPTTNGDPDDGSGNASSSDDNLEDMEISGSNIDTSDPTDEVASSTSLRSSSASVAAGAVKSSHQTPENGDQQWITSKPIEKARPHTALTEAFSSPIHATIHSASSIQQSSFGNRATSVPSFSIDPDPVSTFKRFSAFLHKHGSSSDDEESDESDGDGFADTLKPSKSEEVEELIVHVAAVQEAETGSRDEIDAAHPSSGLERARSNEENETDQLPRFSDALSQPASANGSPWPANVGIKRQLSFLGQEPGGTPSGSGADPQCDLKPHSSPIAVEQSDLFDINDDSQELLRTVDEISSAVFGSTRPLPASKNTFSSGTGNEGQENGVLTSASSDRRMTRSMSTPKKAQERNTQNRDVPNSGAVLVNNEVATDQQSAAGSTANRLMRDENEEASESMSENINVAIPSGTRNNLDASRSSSSLSELSRSPSPPIDAVPAITHLQQPANTTSHPQLDDTDSAIGITQADAVPRKKRKMTGRTSKHFTPQKGAAGKRSSATQQTLAAGKNDQVDNIGVEAEQTIKPQSPPATPATSPEKSIRRTRASSKVEQHGDTETKDENSNAIHPAEDAAQPQSEDQPSAHSTRPSTKKRKSTGKRSTYFTPTKPKPTLDPAVIDRVDFYNTTTSGKIARVPAGTSIAPVPHISAARFGIIQEKLWQEPFWLLIAVTFLNKTTGRAAVPVFWALKEKYVTAEALAEADQGELCDMIHHLGLQNQRSKRMISIARAWVEQPPVKGRRGRTLHYPLPGDGKEFRPGEMVEEDTSYCAGALEIAHLPGCGPYAWDSWRIFCRDVLRGVATDYNGAGGDEDLVPEWKKVVPSDKELRACLRWMWLREGWIWDHESGEKRRATDEEMENARKGEMEIQDPLERKFAAQAAGVEISPFQMDEEKDDTVLSEESEEVEDSPAQRKGQPTTPDPQADEDDESDNIVVTPVVSPAKRKRRRSARLSV